MSAILKGKREINCSTGMQSCETFCYLSSRVRAQATPGGKAVIVHHMLPDADHKDARCSFRFIAPSTPLQPLIQRWNAAGESVELMLASERLWSRYLDAVARHTFQAGVRLSSFRSRGFFLGGVASSRMNFAHCFSSS